MSEYGAIVGLDSVRFERVLPGPVERVWEYLVDPELRGKWLAAGPMELRGGGKVELRFRHADLSPTVEPTPERFKQYEDGCGFAARVTRCEPPRLLSYTWGGEGEKTSEVTFELTPLGGDTLLVLTHRRLGSRDGMANVAAGWHTHIGILEDNLAGRPTRPFWSTHARVEAEYCRRFGVAAPEGGASKSEPV